MRDCVHARKGRAHDPKAHRSRIKLGGYRGCTHRHGAAAGVTRGGMAAAAGPSPAANAHRQPKSLGVHMPPGHLPPPQALPNASSFSSRGGGGSEFPAVWRDYAYELQLSKELTSAVIRLVEQV